MNKYITILFLFLFPLLVFGQDCANQVSAGGESSFIIKTDGTLWAWGGNSGFQIGDSTNFESKAMKQIGLDNDWEQIVSAYFSNFAIKKDGSLWAWGYNRIYGLGNGTDAVYSYPTRIGNDNDWKLVSAHGGFEDFTEVILIKNDGSLWGWGFHNNKKVPTRIGNDNNWKQVAVGRDHVLAVKTDGSLWSWGINAFWQLGNGTINDETMPKRVGTENNWKEVAAGVFHSLGLKNNGTIWGWGENLKYSLGVVLPGGQWKSPTPYQIGSANDWKNLVQGMGHHSMAIKTDGSLWSWGNNEYGETGHSAQNILIQSPTKVGDNWISVYRGYSHCIGKKTDGSVYTWGRNHKSQLGSASTGGANSIPSAIKCPGVFNINVIIEPINTGEVNHKINYSKDELCKLKAIPNSGYEFISWKEDGNIVSTNSELNFKVTNDRVLTATFKAKSSIYHHKFSEINISPNPIKSELFIEGIDISPLTLKLFNSEGRLLLNMPLNKRISIIDLTYFHSGNYYYKLLCGLEVIKEGKLVKE